MQNYPLIIEYTQGAHDTLLKRLQIMAQAELVANPQLCEQRAMELAAAETALGFERQEDDLEAHVAQRDRAGLGDDGTFALYDRLHMIKGPSFRSLLVDMTGTRTLILDIDDILQKSTG